MQRWTTATYELIIACWVCVNTHLHMASAVSVRGLNLINWDTCSVHSQNCQYLCFSYDSWLKFSDPAA